MELPLVYYENYKKLQNAPAIRYVVWQARAVFGISDRPLIYWAINQ
jgi:hypothetical protein